MEINYEQAWFPYDKDYKRDNFPLILPPGKIFEYDIKIALGNWAWNKGLTFAGVVSEDELHRFEIKIKPKSDNPEDWAYDI